jgi:hypothetical protein
MTNTYPRETVEWQPITVTKTISGVTTEITTGVTVAITAKGTRPTTWAAPTTLDGKIGVMLTGLTPGLWTIWSRTADSPETPVNDCGNIRIT